MRYGVYLYVDGFDLHDVAESIKGRLTEIAARFPQVRVIDDRFERTPDLKPDDLATWNLGLNFDVDQDCMRFVPSLLESIRSLAQESGREFAIGYFDRRSNIDEAIGFIDPSTECSKIARVLDSLAESG